MFGQSYGSGDKHVCALEQNDQVMSFRCLSDILRTRGGDRVPGSFNGSANAVLVVLREAMPQRGRLMLAARQVGHRTKKRGQLSIAIAHGCARWAVRIDGPQKERKHYGPQAPGQEQ